MVRCLTPDLNVVNFTHFLNYIRKLYTLVKIRTPWCVLWYITFTRSSTMLFQKCIQTKATSTENNMDKEWSIYLDQSTSLTFNIFFQQLFHSAMQTGLSSFGIMWSYTIFLKPPLPQILHFRWIFGYLLVAFLELF